MLKIGDFNKLKINRLTDFGAYLDGGNGVEILIPAKYLPEGGAEPETELEVFVYTDSEDRLIATTERPHVKVGQFAYLQVVDTHNRVGAFLDWGLAKDLLCPFNEQRNRMEKGLRYLVYVYLDEASKRVVASSKVEKYLGNVYPDYRSHQIVEALVCQRTEIGYKVIVDDMHPGMIYLDELTEPLAEGRRVKAFVRKVREDGKLDVTLKDTNAKRAQSVADRITEAMKANGGSLEVTDKSSPEVIADMFGCSKKDFKKAVGFLYKERRILIEPGRLVFP